MRWGVVGLCAIGLVADGAYWSHLFASGTTEASQLLLYPERLVGREVVLTLVDVRAVSAEQYTVGEGRWSVIIQAAPLDLKVGDELYIGVHFVDSYRADELWRELAPERGGKKLLGLLTMVLVSGLVLSKVRLQPDGLALG